MKNHRRIAPILVLFSLITMFTPMVLMAQPSPIQVEFDEFPGGILKEFMNGVQVTPGPTQINLEAQSQFWLQPIIGRVTVSYPGLSVAVEWIEPEGPSILYNFLQSDNPEIVSDGFPYFVQSKFAGFDGTTFRNGIAGLQISVTDFNGVTQPADVTFFDHGDGPPRQAPETVPTLPLLAIAGVSLVLLRRFMASRKVA
jgi:hypothetical protein